MVCTVVLGVAAGGPSREQGSARQGALPLLDPFPATTRVSKKEPAWGRSLSCYMWPCALLQVRNPRQAWSMSAKGGQQQSLPILVSVSQRWPNLADLGAVFVTSRQVWQVLPGFGQIWRDFHRNRRSCHRNDRCVQLILSRRLSPSALPPRRVVRQMFCSTAARREEECVPARLVGGAPLLVERRLRHHGLELRHGPGPLSLIWPPPYRSRCFGESPVSCLRV